jgi:hypothetical protein
MLIFLSVFLSLFVFIRVIRGQKIIMLSTNYTNEHELIFAKSIYLHKFVMISK